ncbi:MAG: hypothetical protein V1747_06020 [Candidatus Omnitrophota bacterium]
MNKKIGVLGCVPVLLGMFLLSGCATDSYQTSSGDNYSESRQLGKSSIQRFEDLPVPAGFSMYRKESFIFQNNKTRMGTMSYTGNADIVAVIEFYKKQMALNQWNLLTTVEFDKVVMSFEKDTEACIITIEKRGMGKVMLAITISPISKGAVVIKEKNQELK